MLMPAIRAMDYPCFCLWRGFWQITRTAPWRRMILHFSHIGLTDARTFIAPRSYRDNEKQRKAQETASRRKGTRKDSSRLTETGGRSVSSNRGAGCPAEV